MTMYLLTEQEHALCVYALNIGIAKHYDLAQDARIGDVIEMLKSMKPVEPKAWVIEFENGESELHFHDANNSLGETQVPLYAKEQQ